MASTLLERERERAATPAVTQANQEDLRRHRRLVIDRKRLQAEIGALVEEAENAEAARPRILEHLKDALAKGREEIYRRFEEGLPGPEAADLLCYLADQVIRVIYDHAGERLYPLGNPSTSERLALVAVGGYGRGELAPGSDIDLLFLLPYKITPRSEQVVETTLYFLWDLGFKVGHATRSADDCIRQAKADMTIRTNLLEMRFLWGDQPLFLDLKSRYEAEVQHGSDSAYVEAKLGERDRRHRRHGDGSRYALEPNIKEGKGGLRDLHTLFWIAKYIYHVDDVGGLVQKGVLTRAEVNRFAKAEAFLWTLRFHLHLATGRPEERLTFDLQQEIAPWLGYLDHAGSRAVERFMKRYFMVAKDVGDLTRIFCAQLEAKHNRRSRFRLPLLQRKRTVAGFKLEGDRITVAKPESFAEKPIDLLRIFLAAQNHDLDIHPDAQRWITQNLKLIGKQLREDPKANQIFLDILTHERDPEPQLRRMNEAGVFGRFLPDFGRVVSQMQFNMYHHYTVDEHTIMAIGILHDIEQGALAEEAPIATEVVHKVLNRKVLYIAVLLHDIAKGRPGDHSEVGAKLAHKVCPRLGFSEEETETVAWLVLHHLKMSDIAFKRDLEDPQTIERFADLVQSLERLRLLLVLTVADIRAVGPNVWNNWKAALLRDLYWRTEEVLSGGLVTEGRERRIKAAEDALRAALADWPKKEVAQHIKRGYPSYWLSCNTETHLRHARLVREAEAQQRPLTVDTRVDRYRGVTEITIYTADHSGLFSRIAGAIAVAGASVEGARIFTLSNGMALDTFWIHDADGGPFDSGSRLAKLSSAIERTLDGRLNPSTELKKKAPRLPSRFEVFTVRPRVLIDNKASRRYTVIEVNGRDRPGLLHRVTMALTRLNLVIHSAKITTFGEHVVDVFYVQDVLGAKVEKRDKLKRIEKRLIEALSDPTCAPAKPKPVKGGKLAQSAPAKPSGTT
ncbi:MAG: [protein-PII] uridylyltransferase [Rhodovibrionaceae bacterium]